MRIAMWPPVMVWIEAMMSCKLIMEGTFMAMVAVMVCVVELMGTKMSFMILVVEAMVPVIIMMRPMTHLMVIIRVKIVMSLLVVPSIVISTVRAFMVGMVMRYIVVLVTFIVVLGVGTVMIGWFSSHWDHMWVLMVVIHMLVVWLHSQDQLALINIRLRSSEDGAIAIKGSVVALVPPVCIKHIKIVFPVEIETTSFMVIGVSLNVVKQQIPWHILSLKTFTP